MNEIAGRHSTALVRRVTLLTAAAVLLAAVLVAGVSPKGVSATGTVTVDSSGDTNARDGVITAREAVLLVTGALAVGTLDAGEADNVVGTPGAASADTIVSAIPGGGLILLTAPLPALSTGNDTLDGGGPGTIIDGQTTSFTCLQMTSNGNVIKGGTIRRCSVGIEISSSADGNTLGGTTAAERGVIIENTTGIQITGAGTSGNTLIGSYIGVASSGVSAAANGAGVRIESGASGNTIGGTTAAERNVISGNSGFGVTITGSGTTGNTVSGNYIGTNAAGSGPIANGSGVTVNLGATGNNIGMTSAGNVISGNTNNGVAVGANSTSVRGNLIGTDASGISAIPNGKAGIFAQDVTDTVVGGTLTDGNRNIISGNGEEGIRVAGSSNSNFVVKGNIIGLNAAGADLGNTLQGVIFFGGSNITIGGVTTAGTCALDCNVISGNGDSGVSLNGPTGSFVKGNFVGVNLTGTGAIPNSEGVVFGNGNGNTIGGTTSGERNVISGNSSRGIRFFNGDNHTVGGNYIGLGADGSTDVGNGAEGVYITSTSTGNTIGGSAFGAGNVISGNTLDGVIISGSSGNAIRGNYIGTDAAGMAAIANGSYGVAVLLAASGNTIGGAVADEGNVISGNSSYGVGIGNAGTTGNFVRGNLIGTNAAGTGLLANVAGGVFVGSSGNTIGGTAAGAGNVIGGGSNGIALGGGGGSSNVVQGNFIGTDRTGTLDLGSTILGVWAGEPNNLIGGTAAGAGNTIAFNDGPGVCVRNAGATGNSIRGNSIYANGKLGIDIKPGTEDCSDPASITPNDAYPDSDTGPNDLQNFPDSISATFDGTNTTISGGLVTALPETAFVDVYASDVADGSGNGEGRAYLGTAVPNPAGAWSLTIPGLPPYTRITATATNGGGSTSEFSAVYTMSSPPGAGLSSGAVAYKGETSPIGSSYEFFGPGQVPNTTGEVVFWSALLSGTQGIFRWLSGSTTKYVATGDAAPGGGTFTDLADAPVVNASGDVVFWAATSAPTEGIYLRASGGAITKLVGVGDAAPGGSSFLSFDPPTGKEIAVINNLGDITFWASLASTGQGIYLRKSDGTLLKVAATGDPTPAGGTFSTFLGPTGFAMVPIVTENQEVAFKGFMTGGPAQGIFLYGEGLPLTKVAATGDASPASGTYSAFGRAPSPNDSGQVAFWASLTGSALPSCPSAGLGCGVFVWEDGTTTKAFASGDAASPQTGGLISDLGPGPFMNDSGQITVWSGVSGGLASQSIVRYTDGSLVNVAAIGNPTAIGGTFSDFIDPLGLPANPLPNNQGRVVYWGDVAGGSGTEGIFITQAPASQVVVVPGPVAGAAAPGTNGGTFGDAFDLDISAQGEAVFANTVNNGTADSGIFRYLFFAGEPVQDVALEGQGAPGGGMFSAFYFPVNNDNGQIVARASTTGGGPAEGLYLFFAGSAERMAATGESAVGGGGTYASFGDPSMNNVGQVAGTSSLSGGDDGLYLFFAGSPLSGVPCQAVGGYQQCKLAAASGAAPGGDTYLFFAGSPAINNSGMVAQRSTLNAGGQEGLYLFFAGSPIAGVPCQVIDGIQQCKLVSTGTSAPGGGTFSSFGNPMINAGGQVVVSASVSGGTSGVFLFFAGSPISGLPCQLVNGIQQCRLAGVGDSVLSSTFTGFSSATANDAAQAVARATIAATATADEGLFLFFAGYPPVKVALEGDPAATGSGTYGGTSFVFPYFAMNNGAQVVFVAKISGGSTTQGVFFASLDTDGDGVMDFLDNCPTLLNTDQNNTDKALRAAGWNVVADELGNACDTDDDGDGALDTAEPITCRIAADCDSDGFFDGIEDHVGTDPTDRCADTTTPYDERGSGYSEPLSPRPVDINDDRAANLTDILAYIPVFNQSVSPGNVRYDIKQDSTNKIALADILAFIPYFGQTCTP